MGCLQNSFQGVCNYFDPEGDNRIEMSGFDSNGYCTCDCDPDPNDTCDCYQSDNMCECGCDLNIEECECEEDDL